ncbi:hypothetical protein [Nocardiopsis ansamitocini]|nr:hypothetical protein [Nocardiopsis ansamitocini]
MVGTGAQAEEPASGNLDGFTIGWVPAGVGTQVSDFSYEWEEVAFSSRVWERELDNGDGFQVDLTVAVLRGDRLVDQAALLAFLSEYHEQDPNTWDVAPFSHGDLLGGIAPDHAFWLVEPGLAVSVRLAPERFGADDLTATARGVTSDL